MSSLAPLSELFAQLPSGVVIDNPDRTVRYMSDWARDPSARPPLAVVRVESTEHVSTTLAWAHRHRVGVVPRGAGTGLSGGATADAGVVVVSLERMAAVDIDTQAHVAKAQAGALNIEVKRAAEEVGLWYPPDPSSYEICTIGGNVATNAGGLCCVKYGVTRDFVLGMQVVLSDGTAVDLGGTRLKDAAGYSLINLFVGSEGTLGIVTEVTLRLLPQPAPSSTLVASFPTTVAATQAVLDITGVCRPSVLELMDHTTIDAVESMTSMGLDRSAGALLLARSDGPDPASAAEIAAVEEICRRWGATEIYSTDDLEEGEAFTQVRRLALPAIERLGSILLEDVGVPVPALPDLVEGIEEIARANNVTIAVIAHAGDGNTHPVVVYDPQQPAQLAAAETAFAAVMDLALQLKGTITGEHGVGRLKRDWLPQQLGAAGLALQHTIKRAFDPHNLLNPGAVLLPENV
ncbi:FAD-binding oxidoreductase [Gordonia humi]|uniref:Glycolate oxidase n=1 Tax=Gordonia humi TaxID=686429 RepID=A0A840F2B1_9ACTN|nr:FAD-linked oxidase C-terminal domain-containing protein [Gordonia humi]MBB4138031.1 glycolate oxidase [Gordonia humi]